MSTFIKRVATGLIHQQKLVLDTYRESAGLPCPADKQPTMDVNAYDGFLYTLKHPVGISPEGTKGPVEKLLDLEMTRPALAGALGRLPEGVSLVVARRLAGEVVEKAVIEADGQIKPSETGVSLPVPLPGADELFRKSSELFNRFDPRIASQVETYVRQELAGVFLYAPLLRTAGVEEKFRRDDQFTSFDNWFHGKEGFGEAKTKGSGLMAEAMAHNGITDFGLMAKPTQTLLKNAFGKQIEGEFQNQPSGVRARLAQEGRSGVPDDEIDRIVRRNIVTVMPAYVEGYLSYYDHVNQGSERENRIVRTAMMTGFEALSEVFAKAADKAEMRSLIEQAMKGVLGQGDYMGPHIRTAGFSLMASQKLFTGKDLNDSNSARRGFVRSDADALKKLLAAQPRDNDAIDAIKERSEDMSGTDPVLTDAKRQRRGATRLTLFQHGELKTLPRDKEELEELGLQAVLAAVEARMRADGYSTDWVSEPDLLASVRDDALNALAGHLPEETRPALGDASFKDEVNARAVALLVGHHALPKNKEIEKAYKEAYGDTIWDAAGEHLLPEKPEDKRRGTDPASP